MRVMKPNGRVRRDRKGRKRQRKGLFWVPVMVALGLWPEESRKRILDWEVGKGPGEDAESWLKLLTRLEERGIRGANGLRLIIHDGGAGLEEALDEVHFAALRQRCLFHKLRNVLRAITFPDEVKGEAARCLRRLILQEASAIWQAADKESARQRQEAFCLRWAQSQPQAVETLCRDFADTLTFYDVLAWAAERGQAWPVAWLRTTSPLERVNRSYRRKLRQMVIAHSEIGLQAVFYQATIRIEHSWAGDLHGWTGFIEQLLWDSS
jgi:transposase-like protein